jgi:cytidylate kinase
MIITIDGPAGSGKSTIARKLAAKLHIAYLDTGAMYRAIALHALRGDIDMTDPDAVAAAADRADIDVDCGPTHTRVTIGDEDVSESIRGMDVSRNTSIVARNPRIRAMLVERQRAIGRELGALVTEGRDQGSVVFPDADLKVVMDATLERRAKRRHVEMLADGEEVRYKDVLDNMRHRDETDAHQWTPLLSQPNVMQLDTSNLSIAEVIDVIVAEIERRGLKPAQEAS